MTLIYTIVETTQGKLLYDVPFDDLDNKDIGWFWMDFSCPTEEEIELLTSFFKFHHLSIEDCLHLFQRPKIDFYDEYNFLVLHALTEDDLNPDEIDLFIGKNFVVTFHLKAFPHLKNVEKELSSGKKINWHQGHIYVAYLIMDKIVDDYFPVFYKIEDRLNELDVLPGKGTKNLISELFEVRADLLKLRRSVTGMRDLFYRIINSSNTKDFLSNQVYFSDIYDHLIKLTDMIEANKDMTADIRDNYISVNSDRMNNIMMVLTLVTSIFIPLTFIVGIYGMNFENMPELKWQYGYFIVLGVMLLLGVLMYIWFKKKGWLDFKK